MANVLALQRFEATPSIEQESCISWFSVCTEESI